MGGARRPRLPKRSVIERLTQKGPECMPEMMAMLGCFKDNNFNEQKCASSMKALNECVSRQVCALDLVHDFSANLTRNLAKSAIEAEEYDILSFETALLHPTAIVCYFFVLINIFLKSFSVFVSSIVTSVIFVSRSIENELAPCQTWPFVNLF